ncbi:MAG TPA: hypothetical protein PK283_04500 [Thiotrichales bacterium]|nr:hypothetical protein [Thiotrichales bacterium]
MFGGLNNDFVLWVSLGTIIFTVVVLVAWGIKTVLAMEGLDKESQ